MNNQEVGIIVLGSQSERHGQLPEDTDTKLAAHVALKTSFKTGAKLVGIVNTASEFEYIKHGQHHSIGIVLTDIKSIIENTLHRLNIKRFVIVNGHGGNKLIVPHLHSLEETLGVQIEFNNRIIESEGAHAASEECSMAVAAGLVTTSALNFQGDFKRHPEVGFVGMKDAHANLKIKKLAEETLARGVSVDVEMGKELLDKAVDEVVNLIMSMQNK